MTSLRSLLLLLTAPAGGGGLFQSQALVCFAFAPTPAVPTTNTRRQTQLLSTKGSTTSIQVPTQSSLDKLEVIKSTLKRPRGASIGVEYAPSSSEDGNNNKLSDGDLSILSMQLRKSKCAAIWTSDSTSVAKIVNEQETSRGDFPGPVPVIYCGPVETTSSDATAVVLEYGVDNIMDSLNEVGIIWKVNTMDQLQDLVDAEKNAGGVYLLSKDMLPTNTEDVSSELKDMLSNLPKSIVTIAPLSTMLPENKEIALGKHYASLGISSLLLENACVGDEEDIKYAQYAIEELNKKSSSSFSMTGLTGEYSISC